MHAIAASVHSSLTPSALCSRSAFTRAYTWPLLVKKTRDPSAGHHVPAFRARRHAFTVASHTNGNDACRSPTQTVLQKLIMTRSVEAPTALSPPPTYW